MKKPTSAAIGKALDVLLWLHENTSDGQDRDDISRVRDLLWDLAEGVQP